MNMKWLAYGLMWMSIAAGVTAGIYVTHSNWCLWAFVIPIIVGAADEGKDSEEDED